MAQHNDLGTTGEEAAIAFLREKGYSILTTNYRYGKAEIDIIARMGDELVIIEVKTRTSTYYGDPGEAVGRRKELMVAAAADHYISKNDLDVNVRYDIISVIINKGKVTIDHIEDAFYPFMNL